MIFKRFADAWNKRLSVQPFPDQLLCGLGRDKGMRDHRSLRPRGLGTARAGKLRGGQGALPEGLAADPRTRRPHGRGEELSESLGCAGIYGRGRQGNMSPARQILRADGSRQD